MNSRIGEIGVNNQGQIMEIIAYNQYSDIDIRFHDGTIKKASYKSFLNGSINNPYYRSYLGIGYKGEGNNTIKRYDAKSSAWSHMLKRCYDSKYFLKYPTYKDCFVVPEWHNFQSFAAWFDKNFYRINGQRMELDKDILVKNNKIYSPDTCVFVPQKINALFIKSSAARGDFPIGVTKKKSGKYLAQCHDEVICNLGLYDNPEDAFRAYKKRKESVIKKTAKGYHGLIPEKLFDALMKYEVDIND